MIAEAEIWQVMTAGEIYQADLETLKQWIAEGLVQPTDQVRKGNLRWIEAERAPLLRRVFTGEEVVHIPQAATPPVSEPTTSCDAANDSQTESQPYVVASAANDKASPPPLHADSSSVALPPQTLAAHCHHHQQVVPKYVCRVCLTTYCEKCPQFIEGGRVALCPLCGDFCNLYSEVRQKTARQQYQQSGFGFGDFKEALGYPFRNTVGLICVSLLYALLMLGGIKGHIAAFVVMFGCISLVIKQVAWGRMERSFVPDFTEFSMWDDVVVPIFLGIGITLVTIGPTILLIIALLLGWFGGAKPINPTQAALEQAKSEQITPEDMRTLINSNEPKKEEEAAKKVEQMRARNFQVVPETEAQSDEKMLGNMLNGLVSSPGLVVILLLLTLGWAFFYYPMALMVAGFTEDFKSVINPLVGLDTIRRMGSVYVKAFLMYVGLEVALLGLSIVVAIITAPFEMPFIGNLPAKFIDGTLTFYLNLVIACLFGLALYKCADKLDICTE